MDHQGIIKLFGYYQDKHHLYLFLEYAPNGCLFYYIDSTEGLPESLALRFLYQTALAVNYLHEKNFVH